MAKERDERSPGNSSSKSPQNDWEHISADPNEDDLLREPSWHPLAEVVHHEEDLVSIFQDDFETVGKGTADSEWELNRKPSAQKALTFSRSEVDTQPVNLNPALENWSVGTDIPVATVITFYLAPRQTQHFLIGGLARQLRVWLPDLCQAYGWELDLLSVRPDYLKWTLRDFPETLIREMLQTVREKTSLRIFRVFPNLKEGANSSDFWAPGYLVDNQNRDFTTHALMSQVAQDRLGR